MRAMRLAWLKRVPEPGSYKSQDEVTAVVMDWPVDSTTVTVLASSLGDGSLYTTATFGILGGIGHEKVRTAAIRFIACAQKHLGETALTSDFPYPDRDSVRFYMVTPAGVRTVSYRYTEIRSGAGSGGQLFSAAQDLVTELRRTVKG
jgi:hypothetical protein